MKTILLQNKRLDWIDWMKTIGIYLVILGHFQSVGDKFVYFFICHYFLSFQASYAKKKVAITFFGTKYCII